MESKHAVLVGVDGYASHPLSSAVKDALPVLKSLGEDSHSGLAPIVSEVDSTILSTPAQEMPVPLGSMPDTRDAIFARLKPYYDDPDPVDLLIVYLAEHGLIASPDGRVRRTVILPSDVKDTENGRNMI